MKVIASVRSGISSSFKALKGVVVVWLFSILLVSLVAMPMRSALKAGLGDSMITEKLAKGIDIEVLADLGSNFKSLISYFSSGLLMILITGFLINSFLAGGLFNSMKASSGIFSAGEFFRSSSKNFWSFFVISLLICTIILLMLILIVVIPVSVVAQSEISSEGSVFKTVFITVLIFLIVLTLLFLVADYARAWQVSKEKNACFKALGFGFRQTFRTFLSSFPLMLVLLAVQMLYGWLVLIILSGIKPQTGAGILLLFLLSQILFIVKILLKTWRYGSVTRLMELNISTSITQQ
jgi:hypothetical protein